MAKANPNDRLDRVERQIDTLRVAVDHQQLAVESLEDALADVRAVVKTHEEALTVLARAVLGVQVALSRALGVR